MMEGHNSDDEGHEIDGVPLDDLLPPPTSRAKRKEPNAIMEAETQLKAGMKTAIPPTNKGLFRPISFLLFTNSMAYGRH